MDYKAIRLNPRERKELAISEIVLIALAAVGLIIVGWFAWFRPSSTQHTIDSYKTCVDAGNPVQLSYPSVCATKDGKRFVNPDQKLQSQNTSATGTSQSQQQASIPPADGQYLVIAEWNVRLPLPAEYNDMKYAYVKDELSERTTFTFKRLEDAGICKNDAGVSMTRAATKNEPPYSIENPESIARVGEYYYYTATGGSPCFDPEDAGQMQVVKTINEGKPTEAIRQTLRKLQQGS